MTVPRAALVELTAHCNLNCVHCYIVDNRARGELTTAEAIDILEQLAELGVLMLTLSGGEILLRRDWYTIATAARRLKFSLCLFTNATLITPAIADQIAQLNPQKVEVSLHGSRTETVDAITRVIGSYAKILEGIRLLRERQVRVKVKANLLNENLDEAREFTAQARQLGVQLRTVSPFILPRLDNDPATQRHMTSREDMTAYHHEEFQRLSNEEFLQQVRHPCHSEKRVCAIGVSEWVVSADARLYPCFNWRLRGFNLRQVRIADVAGRMEELYHEMVDLTNGDLESCAEGHHLFRHHCGALSLRLHGDVRAHIPGFCDQAHAEEDALRAVAQERGLAIEDPAVVPVRGPATP